jgi:predicted dehydrogenase
MRKLQIGVVGIGFGQKVLVPAFRMNADCEVVAICASTFTRAHHVASELQISKAYGDWHDLVVDPQIDAIAIATPPVSQPAIVLAAFANGKHVFCEKPIAATLSSAKAILNASLESGKAHMVDFEFPEIETWQYTKALLDRGILGHINHCVVSWQVETYANRVGLDTWKHNPDMGGGTLNAFMSHTFYYLEWLLGPIKRMSVRLFSPVRNAKAMAEGDTLVALCLEHEDGIPVSAAVSSNAFLGTGHRVEVYGNNGTIILDNPTRDYANGFTLRYGTREIDRLEPIQIEHKETEDGRIIAVGRIVDRFIRWARDGIVSRPNLTDGYRVQLLLDAARRSHMTGQEIEV